VAFAPLGDAARNPPRKLPLSSAGPKPPASKSASFNTSGRLRSRLAKTQDHANEDAHVALVGNPNTGNRPCSMLFRVCAAVGTIPAYGRDEEGAVRGGRTRHRLIDLPGTYSSRPQPGRDGAVDLLLGSRTEEPGPT